MAFEWLRKKIICWRWRKQQDLLREQMVERDDFPWVIGTGMEGRPRLRRVGGLDISFFSDGGNPNDDRACVAFIVCEFNEAGDDLATVWKDFVFVRMTEPYIAGYLAFREASHYCEMFRRLAEARPDLVPDVVLVDGNGVLHPRGFGIACHVGVLSGQCMIGVAKNLHMVDGLSRDDIKERCSAEPGSFVPLVGDSGRTWGAALLPQPRRPIGPKKNALPTKNPIYVSVGHRIGLQSCVAVVNQCLISARVPEPVRLADVLSREQVRMVREEETKKLANAQGKESRFRCRTAFATFAITVALSGVGLILLQRARRRALY